MKEPERILITGFMAAGKTTVGAALAERLGCNMLDLDQLITEREGCSIQALIDERGETLFREAETRALREALEKKAARVITLGGGTWTRDHNRSLIDKHRGFTIWLDTPFELCWQRIKLAGDTRPLARNLEGARKLYEERRRLYRLAPLRIEVKDASDAGMIADEIINALQGFERT
ncbi:MAG TPA: shikimate kinase [Pyrinomonadaceae bacterium]|jgi:shikimate kinase